MAMVIANNMSAMLTLGELNKNNSALGKQLKKVSSGMCINSAADDASGYSISERMRVQIRSLDQDDRNIQNGISLLRVAEGGIQSIIEEIRSLKELALNAANDTNTDLDRATIQKEFDNRRANIDDIASTTNYNGKLLLDGRYSRREIAGTEGQPDEPTDAVGTITGSGSLPSLATFTIDKDGVYTLAPNCECCEIIVNAANVEIVGSGEYNNSIYITCQKENTNLWLRDFQTRTWGYTGSGPTYTPIDKSVVRFGSGDKNTLNIEGDSTFYTFLNNDNTKATIYIGGGLTIYGNGVLTREEVLETGYHSPFIGTDRFEASDADVTINSGTLNIGHSDCPAIGSSEYGSIGDITINGGTVNVTKSYYTNGIGASNYGECGNITINGGTVVVCSDNAYGATAIGGGFSSVVGDITLNGGKVYAFCNNWVSAGTGLEPPEAIGRSSGEDSVVGTITLPEELTTGTTTGHWGGTISISKYEQDLPDVPTQKDSYWEGNPLVIHHGTKANQALNVYIDDMHTWSLKNDVMTSDDMLEVERLSGAKAEELRATLMEAAGKSLEDAKVVTQHDANVALRIIDGAMDYALDEITRIGAYISRLEFTDANIVTANESTQASESTMRDADMAKEMAEYTKANVLAQAAQSMLAQANQNSSSVMSLLQ